MNRHDTYAAAVAELRLPVERQVNRGAAPRRRSIGIEVKHG